MPIIDALLFAVIVAVVYAIGMGIRYATANFFKKKAKKTDTKMDDAVIVAIEAFGRWFYLVLGLFVAELILQILPEFFNIWLVKLFFVWLGIHIGYMLSLEVNLLQKTIKEKFSKEYKSLAGALPSIATILKIFLWIIVFTIILSNLGFNVTALIAGLGIGGVALAFALQKILSDLFSAFVIFIDRPFTVGDSVEIGDRSGSVEHIGLKTTRIRAFTGEQIIIPNEDLVGGSLRNTTRLQRRRTTIFIPVSYDATKEQLAMVPAIAERVVCSKSPVTYTYTNMREYDKYAVIFRVRYFVEDPAYDKEVRIRHEVMSELLEELKKHNIPLGYPIELGAIGR